MAYARSVGKPVLIDFTGFGCVNCRKMEAAVWTNNQVRNLIDKDYVLISLYVDDKTPLPETSRCKKTAKRRNSAPSATVGATCSARSSAPMPNRSMCPSTTKGVPLVGSYAYKEDVKPI